MYHLGEKDYSWANQTEMCNFLKAGGGGGGGTEASRRDTETAGRFTVV